MQQMLTQPDDFWTHVELAAIILTPIGAGLWAFFNKLTDHSKEDTKNFGTINTSLGKMDTKLDAMWSDFLKGNDKK